MEDLEFLPEVEAVRHSVSLSRSGISAVLAGASSNGCEGCGPDGSLVLDLEQLNGNFSPVLN